MAWIKPTPVAAGDPLTETLWNQDVVANAEALDPFFGAWTTYTPTTNITLGSGGTSTGRYVKVGRFVHERFRIVLGSSGFSVPSDASVTTAFTANAALVAAPAGIVQYIDVSATAWRMGFTKGNFLGTEGTFGFVSATVPFTWAAGDIIDGMRVYEAGTA
jgi:hypothetical protein